MSSDEKDFGYWMELFKTDPERAERERAEEIERLISSVPSERQERLRALQWRIDMERVRHKDSPVGSAIALYKLMMEKVYGKEGLVEALDALLQPTPTSSAQKKPVLNAVRYVDFAKKSEKK